MQKMIELDPLLEEFDKKLKKLITKYEFLINIKSSELNIPEENHRSLIERMAEAFYQISLSLVQNINKFKEFSTDIIERKKMEETRQKSEDRFRSLVETTSDWIWEVDQNSIYTYASPKVKDLLGYEPEEIIGKTPFDLMPLDEAESVGRIFQSIIDSHTSFMKLENTNLHKNGQLIVLETSGVPIFDESGNLLGYRGIDRDITDRKKIEQQLKENEEKYRQITENLHDLINIFNKKFKYEYINEESTFKLLGYKKEDMIGKNAYDFLDPDELEHVFKAVKKAFIKGEATMELRYKHKDGHWLWFESKLKTFTDKDGEIKWLTISREITKRKKAEQKLKESEEKYRTILENIKEGYFEVDLTGNFTFFNDSFCKILGYPSSELIGNNFSQFVDKELKQIIYNHYNNIYKKKAKQCLMQFELMKKNREKIFIENSIYLRYDSEGEKVGFCGIARDITEMKKVEQKLKESEKKLRKLNQELEKKIEERTKELKESEKKYRNLVEDTPDLIQSVKIDGSFAFVNHAWLNTLGYTKEELPSLNLMDIVHSESQQHCQEMFLRVMAGESPTNIHATFITKDGKPIYVEGNAGPHYINDEIVETRGIFHDVTIRKKAEQKLIESEEKYRNLVKTSPNSIILTSLDGKIIEYNEITEKYLDLFKDQIVGKNILDLHIIPDNIRYPFQEQWTRATKNRVIEPNEFEYVNKSGEKIWLKNFFSFVKIGGEDYVQIVSEDITKRKKAEIMIKKEIEKLKELDQMRKDLITRVSHELKTPLVSIFSGSELLLNYYKDQMSDEIVKFIEIIHRGGQRLNYLIKNLLDISRIEYDKLKLNREKGNLVEIIKNCIDDIKYLAKQRNLSWSIDLPEKLYLEFDKIRFEQVISNLLSNAIKNTPSNGNIYVNLKEKENHIYITIKDTGVGLTEKEMEKIFTKFGKIERYGKELDVDIEGSGLGLYISKEIVNLHEGQIWAESEGRNKGSTFIIKVPIKMENKIYL